MITVPVFNNGEHIGYFAVPANKPLQVSYLDRVFDYSDGGYHLMKNPYVIAVLYKTKEEIVNGSK